MLAMHQRVAVWVKKYAIFQNILAAINTSDDVVIVPAGFLTDRVTTQGTDSFLTLEKVKNLPSETQLVLHPLNPQLFPFQFLCLVVRLVLHA